MREASGSAQPQPEDHVRENELDMVPALAGPVELKGLAEPVRLHVAHLA